MDLAAEREKSTSDLEEQDAPDELVYANVLKFVEQHLSPLYGRYIDLEGRAEVFTWCGQWWRHREAVSRLTALWKAWESLRKDPTTGLAVWWRDYADPTMRALFDEHGPFEGCSPRRHRPKTAPLVTIPPPEGLFD